MKRKGRKRMALFNKRSYARVCQRDRKKVEVHLKMLKRPKMQKWKPHPATGVGKKKSSSGKPKGKE